MTVSMKTALMGSALVVLTKFCSISCSAEWLDLASPARLDAKEVSIFGTYYSAQTKSVKKISVKTSNKEAVRSVVQWMQRISAKDEGFELDGKIPPMSAENQFIIKLTLRNEERIEFVLTGTNGIIVDRKHPFAADPWFDADRLNDDLQKILRTSRKLKE